MEESEPRKNTRTVLLRVAGLFLLLAAAFGGYLHLASNQQAPGEQLSESISVLGARLDNLETGIRQHEKRLRDLEETTQKLASAPVPPPAVSAPGGAPPADTAAVPATTAPAVSDERIAGLEKEIAALKAASPLQDKDKLYLSIRMLSSFHRLSDKVIGGKPFAVELSAFEESASPDESSGSPLAALSPYAESGIPTFATLLVTFDESLQSLNAAEAVPPAGAGFWDRFVYNLRHLVSIRRIDDAQMGTTVNAIVGRAQAHLEREEIEAAITEIKSLPENARSNFTAWLDDAQMVTEAPSLVGQLEEQVMQKAFYAQPASSAPAPAETAPAPAPAAPPTPPANPSGQGGSSLTPKL